MVWKHTSGLVNKSQSTKSIWYFGKRRPFQCKRVWHRRRWELHPVRYKGEKVYFNSRVPTDWETTHLPVIILTTDTWDPKKVNISPGCSSHEEDKMRIVRSLTSGINRRTISADRKEQSVSRQARFRHIEQQLMKISSTFDEITFWKRLIGKVNIASTYREDADGWTKNRRVSSID